MKFYKLKTIRTLLILIAGVAVMSSCKKDAVIPQPNQIDPGEGAGNAVLTLTGEGLSTVNSIVFDLGNVSASVNPTLNTDKALIFRVPADANVGAQHIVFTNSEGYQFSIPFMVLAVPSITSAFPAEWEAGSNITINGNYLETVDDVSIEGTALKATIVSKTATQLVVTMPAATVSTPKLIIHNNAGSTTTSFVFTNMDNQYKLFTEGFGSGIDDWSWTGTHEGSSDFAVSGSQSLKAIYAGSNAWQGLSFHFSADVAFSTYQSLSFWVKGGLGEQIVDVAPDAVTSGTKVVTKITVPPGVWTHFSIPVSGHLDGVLASRLNFQMEGPPGTSETIYYDNVYFVK
jgi:hypothetical protein